MLVKKSAILAVLLIAVFTLGGCAEMRREPGPIAIDLVNQAHETVQRFKGMPDLKLFASYMATAKGVVILPAVIKGGFVVAGEGGNGVLLAKRDDGSWSPPAFYVLGALSVGLQIGLQDTEIVLVLRSDKAVEAVVENQGKIGADAGVTVGLIGAGAEISTTSNIGVDILAFANSKIGLFGGAALEGAVLARRTDLNDAYYGVGALPRDILYGGRLNNPQADALRATLAGN